MLCEEMRHLIEFYTGTALAHSELTQSSAEVRQQVGTGEFVRRLEATRVAREDAWQAWESHVAFHGCKWPDSATQLQADLPIPA